MTDSDYYKMATAQKGQSLIQYMFLSWLFDEITLSCGKTRPLNKDVLLTLFSDTGLRNCSKAVKVSHAECCGWFDIRYPTLFTDAVW